MKHYLIQSAKVIILGAFLVGFSALAAWTSPAGGFPGSNIAAPLNVGATDQIKSGGLSVGGLAVFGTTTGAAVLNDNANVMNASNLYVSGKINIGPTPPSSLDYSGENLVNVDGNIRVASLVHTPAPYNLRPVCQSGGVLNLCAITPPTVTHGSITYSTAGTYNFQVPFDITSITVKTWGAGGGGGGGGGCMAGNVYGGGGEGGNEGVFTQSTIATTSGENLSVVVGAGGTGGSGGSAGGFSSSGGGGATGSNGGFSRLSRGTSSLVNANGGGGDNGGARDYAGADGSVGQGVVGGSAVSGGTGGAGGAFPPDNNAGIAGGWGNGPGGGGGGGSGGNCNSVNGHSGGGGGTGAAGQVTISW